MKNIGSFNFEGERLFAVREEYRTNGRLAVELIDKDGEPWCSLSVNIVEAPEPEPDTFYAKTWSENAPLREPILATGLFEDTGVRFRTAHVEAELWRIVKRCS